MARRNKRIPLVITNAGKFEVSDLALEVSEVSGRDDRSFWPIGNHILVRRLPQKQKGLIDTSAHDEKAGGEMILAEGEIIAVGPGDYNEDGDFVPTTVKPRQKIIFNARWNDFSSGELVGSDCDRKGPLERPIPQWQWDKRDLHLIMEGDIAGILG